MQLHQLRVALEKAELDVKLAKLGEFIGSSQIFDGLPNEERELLVHQHACMGEYSKILGERISKF